MSDDPALLARIDENVKYLRASFDEHKEEFKAHVDHDNRLAEKLIYPLWESYQQNKGAATLGSLIWSAIGSTLTILALWFSGLVGHK